MTEKKKVHVVDRKGKLAFDQLYDVGQPILDFESGFGFLIRRDILKDGYEIREGWRNES